MDLLQNIKELFTLEQVVHQLSFNQDSPLIFTNLYFWVFFAIMLLGYSIIYKFISLRNTYLFLISLFFYYKTSGLFVIILLFSTVTDFYIGKNIYSNTKVWRRKLLVSLSVIINLSVLGYFKYAYFFTDAINEMLHTNFAVVNYFAQWSNSWFGSGFRIDKIILPVGISFYTFQTISYSVDIYRKQISPLKKISDFGFFVSFFPQLVAGPIVRASDFVPQINKAYHVTTKEYSAAVYLILSGLMKKIILGDYIAVNLIDRVFAQPSLYSGIENILALFGYSLQVYADFSGYTDMAIGLALLLGFRLPKNFNSPYKAKNVAEFWKRWHISLSTWLKDYLYIPLGGNRNGSMASYIIITVISLMVVLLSRDVTILYILGSIAISLTALAHYSPQFKKWLDTNINLLITMLIGGLWHGASWQFIIWGGLNGFALIFYKNWRKISPYENSNTWIANAFKVMVTLSFITFTRIWFRAESTEAIEQIFNQIINSLGLENLLSIIIGYNKVLSVMLLGYIIHWLPVKVKDYSRGIFIKSPQLAQVVLSSMVIFSVYQALSSEMQAFIYFQF